MKTSKLLPILALGLLCSSSANAAVSLTHRYTFDTDASDSAGSINGSLQNGATIVGGAKVGTGAVDINAGTQHVLMANPGTPVVPVSTSFSIAVWAKRDAASVNGWLVGQGDTGASNQSLHVGFRNSNQTAHAYWGDDLQWSPTEATDTIDWHQWVVTFDATTDTQYMYVDGGGAGNFVTRTTTNGDFLGSGTNNFWVGRRRDGQNFDGQIDDVQVYSGVLDAAQVQSLFDNPGSAIPEPSGVAIVGLVGLGVMLRRRR